MLEVVEGVDQPADVVVGVLEEAGVDLHLAGEHRLEVVGHVVPGGDLVGPGGQLGIGRDDAELLLAREGLLAQRVPALVELALVLVGPLRRARGAGAWVAPGAKYMKNGLSGMSAFCWRTQAIALSVMSSVKW